MDEARRAAIKDLQELVARDERIQQLVLIDDLFGSLRLAVWTPPDAWASIRETIEQALSTHPQIGHFWTHDLWHGNAGSESDRLVFDTAWSDGVAVAGSARFRLNSRYRNRGGWFGSLAEPPWPAPTTEGNGAPPIVVVFYSFKGGVGRSTALASFALQRAQRTERVVVVDFDLDAPGVGSLLPADREGTTASWGVVDYLLERPRSEVQLADYYHACRSENLVGTGEILVFPTGRLDSDYLPKLARVNLEPSREGSASHPVLPLLADIRRELAPSWILLDARTGWSEPAGLLLSGLAHLHVLFGTASNQVWQGLRWVVDRLGAARVSSGKAQAECVLVQSMVPRDSIVAPVATTDFSSRALEIFLQHYYVENPLGAADEDFWYVRDSEGLDAPHVAVPISYDPRIAHFRSLEDVARDLTTGPEYVGLSERIADRFVRETAE